jgi:hypothetical protein
MIWAAMERQGLTKKAGYKYNRAGDPEQKYELTQAGVISSGRLN